MSRVWNSIAAVPINRYGVLGFIVIVLAVSGLLAAAWHFFPRWLPRASWFTWVRRIRRPQGGFHLPRWRKPKRRAPRQVAEPMPASIDDDALPDLPAVSFRSRADAYAAEGRYAEAVRERLRAIVRELADARVIDVHPEWTVTELARGAAMARPPLEPALSGAGRIFSDIWYGERPARAEHDQQMRTFEVAVTEILRSSPVGASR